MNIAINTRHLLPYGYKEGIARYIYEISSRLVKNHPEHRFYFFFDRKYSQEYIYSDNVVPVIVSPPARHPILFYLWYEWSVPYYLKKYKIDVFFSPDNFLSLRTRVPQLLTIHDIAYHHLPETIPTVTRWFYQYFMPRYISKATHIVTVSNAVKEELEYIEPGISADKITMVHNALSSTFDQSNVSNKILEGEYFVVLGSINPRKNTERILLAYEAFSLKHPSVKILVIGTNMWRKQSTSVWDRLASSGQLIHIQGANDEAVVNYLKYAVALIFASKYEGFGFPILEGFSCGIPVITSSNSGMQEIGKDACLYVNPYDVEDIAAKLDQIYVDDDLKSSLIEKGKSELTKYSWDKSAAAIGELILNMVK